MPTIGYGYQIIKPGYTADVQNTELIAKVLMSKQREFDLAYQGMKDLQRQSLGINFINKKEQKKIDTFNEDVSREFQSGEFGDLSNANTAQKYYSMFDRIGNDTALVSKYKQDKSYQDQIHSVESKRLSKDPAKAGFGNINYDNFMHRIREYSELDLDSPDAQGYALRPYTDYVDINKEVADLAKSIVPEKFTKQRVENGYIVTETYSGRDPEKVAAAVREYMGSRGVTQVREEAEYTFRRAKGDPAFQEMIFNDHVGYNMNQQREVSGRLDKVNEQLTATKDPAVIAQLAAEKAKLEDTLSQVTVDLKSPDEYFSRDADEIINDISKVATLDNIKNFTGAHSGYSVSTKIDVDRTFLELQKMQQHANEFNTEMQFKAAELAQKGDIAQAKLDKDGKPVTTPSATGLQQAQAVGASYISASDPVHVDYPSTIEAMTASLTKLYAHQNNFLEQGTTHGDNKLSAERVGLELLINPKNMDDSPFYADSPYLRAWKVAMDEVYKTNPTLAEFIGKRPVDNEGWDRLKEANQIIKARVNQMMTKPKNRTEAQFVNALQDVNANKQSMEDFMAAANASGNPQEYIANNPAIKIYGNAVYDFDIPADASKEDKQRVVNMEQMFRPSLENFVDNSYQEAGVGTKVRTIPYGQIRKVETGPDGTVRVYPKDTAFQMATKNDEKDIGKSGAFAEPDAYIMVKQGNKYVSIRGAEIKSKGYFEYKDPSFNSMNWYDQLGLGASAKPQTRWDVSADGQTVPFQIRKSTVSDTIEVSVAGGNWQDMNTSNVAAAIETTRRLIAGSTVAEIYGISPEEDAARSQR